jgi:hypothetical protein
MMRDSIRQVGLLQKPERIFWAIFFSAYEERGYHSDRIRAVTKAEPDM